MYISEIITELQIIKSLYGDIQVTVKDQECFRITLEVRDEVDPKTLEPTGKVVVAK